jgi:hypothetical protein
VLAARLRSPCEHAPGLPVSPGLMSDRPGDGARLWAGCPIRFEHSGHALSRWQTFQHAARLAKAKGAHDRIIGIIVDAQANAIEIMSLAGSRLAEEYEAAQEKGEIQKRGNKSGKSNIPDQNITPTVTDIGFTSKQIHEGRMIRDAEKIEPGIVRRTLQAAIAAGAVEAAAGRAAGTVARLRWRPMSATVSKSPARPVD